VEVLVVVISTQVEKWEKHVIPKLVPLVIPKIGVGIKVTLIDIVTHASKVFRTPNIILKETHVVEITGLKRIPLVEPIDTTCEQHADDLAIRVEHVVLSD
jgi:hypothetical protein